jgi:hypothetical protein
MERRVTTRDDGIESRAAESNERRRLRPVQAEYLLTKIPDGLNNQQNNFRFSTGIVFRFGQH